MVELWAIFVAADLNIDIVVRNDLRRSQIQSSGEPGPAAAILAPTFSWRAGQLHSTCKVAIAQPFFEDSKLGPNETNRKGNAGITPYIGCSHTDVMIKASIEVL